MELQRIYTIKSVIGSICCLFLCLHGFAQQPSVLKETNNPIIPDMIADPSIVKIDGIYYCYATTDGYNKGLKSSGPPVVWKSKDLVNWSFNGIFFPSANGQLYWAPSGVRKVKGKYYLYPTINRNIYAAVADHPEGPFRLARGADDFNGAIAPKPVITEKAPKNTKGIDGEVFIDDHQQAYLFWAQHGAGKLSEDMTAVDTSTAVVIPTKRTGYSEGPIVFKRKGIYYYLYTLEGNENYKYAYGYSRVSPLGSFIFPEQDIIAATDRNEKIYGPGHGSVFSDQDGQYYFAYLEFGIGGTNRQVWVDKLDFNADGTIKPIVLTHSGVKDLKAFKKETNLALGKKITASSTLPDLKVKPVKDPTINRTETYLPDNAIDQSNGTRWMADTTIDKHAFFILDLGKVTAIRRTEAYFVKPTAGQAYSLDFSLDGHTWKPYGGHDDLRIQSPHITRNPVKTRYLRLTILKGVAGLWEFKVY